MMSNAFVVRAAGRPDRAARERHDYFIRSVARTRNRTGRCRDADFRRQLDLRAHRRLDVGDQRLQTAPAAIDGNVVSGFSFAAQASWTVADPALQAMQFVAIRWRVGVSTGRFKISSNVVDFGADEAHGSDSASPRPFCLIVAPPIATDTMA